MTRLRTALDFFAATPLPHWPGLAWFFFGWAVYRLTGWRLFDAGMLRFREFAVVASVEGLSGLVFLHEILVRDIYRFPVVERDARIRAVFDVGANCGFFTLVQAARHPGWQFCCIEPHPVSFGRLERNLAANHLAPRVKTVHAAAGATSGRCTLHVSAESSMAMVAASTSQFLERPVALEVPLVTLDEIAAREGVRPDLLKIDVEGFELEVLRGAAECLKAARHVVLEYHSETLRRDCRERLTEAGFRVSEERGLMLAERPEP